MLGELLKLAVGGGPDVAAGGALGALVPGLGGDRLSAVLASSAQTFFAPLIAGAREQLVAQIGGPVPVRFRERLNAAGYPVSDQDAAQLWAIVVASVAEEPAPLALLPAET